MLKQLQRLKLYSSIFKTLFVMIIFLQNNCCLIARVVFHCIVSGLIKILVLVHYKWKSNTSLMKGGCTVDYNYNY